MTSNAPRCPACGSARARRVVYGLLAQPPADDEIVGGCVIEVGPDGQVSPDYACSACGATWSRPARA